MMVVIEAFNFEFYGHKGFVLQIFCRSCVELTWSLKVSTIVLPSSCLQPFANSETSICEPWLKVRPMDFFQLLVQKHRATDSAFKTHLKNRIQQIREARNEIKNRVVSTLAVPIEAQAQYYSSWLYIAVHMAASLAPAKSLGEIAQYLSVPVERVQETTQFLVSIGLVNLENGVVTMGPAHLHLPKDSVLVRTYHLNWRSKATQVLDMKNERNLHYSVVYSISREDAARLKNMILDLIQENLKVVAPSKEEILIANTIDFFEVGF